VVALVAYWAWFLPSAPSRIRTLLLCDVMATYGKDCS
jgi:hypothetical protein